MPIKEIKGQLRTEDEAADLDKTWEEKLKEEEYFTKQLGEKSLKNSTLKKINNEEELSETETETEEFIRTKRLEKGKSKIRYWTDEDKKNLWAETDEEEPAETVSETSEENPAEEPADDGRDNHRNSTGGSTSGTTSGVTDRTSGGKTGWFTTVYTSGKTYCKRGYDYAKTNPLRTAGWILAALVILSLVLWLFRWIGWLFKWLLKKTGKKQVIKQTIIRSDNGRFEKTQK